MLKKLCWWTLMGLTGFVVLVAVFYAKENWRGKHAWETYRRDREAKGDSFEWASIVPPPVPDNENFAATPLFAELFPKPPEHSRLAAAKLPNCTTTTEDWHLGRSEDLAAWQACLKNSDLLAALATYEPILREIAEASHRPKCRFPIRYEDNFNTRLSHLSPLRGLAKVYRLQALVELSAGQTDAALADVQTCLRLADKLKEEPVLISFLVRCAILDLAIQPVWEGLAAHRWNKRQLEVLQVELEGMDQFRPFRLAIQGERLLEHHTIRWVSQHPQGLFEFLVLVDALAAKGNVKGSCLDRAIPSGWFYQNALAVDRFYTETYLPAVNSDWRRINPQTFKQMDQALETSHATPYNIFFKLSATGMPTAAKKAAWAQTIVDEAAVACAVERYRLARGEYPEKPNALVPEFIAQIPNDVIDGQPLRYRRTGNSEFVLYSVGWNEADDGGQIALLSGEKRHQDLDRGDWVWFSSPQP